jgi:prepilin-type processing-associated H-X9-DG protein
MIELLVVIGIIAILASLLLPVLSRAKQAAQSARCKNNLRQQGVALNMHVSDYEAYPLNIAPGEIPELESSHWAEDLWHLNYWFVQLNTQMRGVGQNSAEVLFDPHSVFRCPSDERQKLGRRPEAHDPAYGYNDWGLRQFGGPIRADQREDLGLGGIWQAGQTSHRPTPEAHIKAPSDMVAIADGFEGTAGGRLQSTFDNIARELPYPPPSKDQPDYGTEIARRRHQGRINVLFCDGHVEGMKLERLFFERSDAALRRWNKDNEPHRERLSN